MSYAMYTPYTFDVRASIKKAFKAKGMISQGPFQKSFIDLMPNDNRLTGSATDLSTHVLVHEHNWLQDSPVCLVPESAKLIQQILQSQFMGQLDVFTSKWPLFSIAIPKETTFGGVHFEGVFVSVSSHQQRLSYIEKFASDCDITTKLSPPTSKNMMLLVNFKTAGELPLDCFVVDVAQIPAKLAQTKDANSIIYELLRFIVGFLVYMSAFDDVVKDIGYIAMPKGDRRYKQKLCMTHIRNVSTGKRSCFHFRNLRHHCFYNRKYKDCPLGSVWIPVNGKALTVVGKKTKTSR